MSIDDIIAKVHKLLAKASDEATTENEAAAFAAKAQSIMDRYKIEQSMIEEGPKDEDEEVRRWEDPFDDHGWRYVPWRGQLAMAVTESCGCMIYRTKVASGNNRSGLGRMIVVGRASDVVVAREIFAFCLSQVMGMQKRYRGNGNQWLNSWRFGVVITITNRLRTEREELVKQISNDTGTALTVVEENTLAVTHGRHMEAIDWADKNVGLNKGRSSMSRVNNSAFAQGRWDGNKVQLRPGQKRLS